MPCPPPPSQVVAAWVPRRLTCLPMGGGLPLGWVWTLAPTLLGRHLFTAQGRLSRAATLLLTPAQVLPKHCPAQPSSSLNSGSPSGQASPLPWTHTPPPWASSCITLQGHSTWRLVPLPFPISHILGTVLSSGLRGLSWEGPMWLHWRGGTRPVRAGCAQGAKRQTGRWTGRWPGGGVC